MLYVTTRNNRDAFTAQRVLRENQGPEGGRYLPMRQPVFTRDQIAALGEKSFGQNVAEILNLLFGTKLTGWDVEFAAGRYPVRLQPLHHRIYVGECWHNPQWSWERLVENLTAQLSAEAIPGNWTKIAVRIAILFGIYGNLRRDGIESMDISVVSADFSAPISAWYAKQWGLPIGRIICCCNENNSLWDLICHGQLRCGEISIPTLIPEADVVVPEDLERLILGCGGSREVQQYLDACRLGRSYLPGDAVLTRMRESIYVSVVSSSRLKDVISGVYRTHNHLLESRTALAYAGLLDYRAKTGETRHAVVLSEKSPRQELQSMTKLMNVPSETLLEWMEDI